ncbi:oxaloacetate decarboxylase [Proteobacteria bacterium 005FR1]|nr:oxaloacetate decarboxylase [Proteobacteria bacterium 005FR1]
MQNELISQGINLMLLGMGVVFVFLTLLVFATSFMSALVMRYFPEPHPEPPVKAPPISSATTQPDARLLNILKAAVEEHRSKHNQR